MQSIKKYKHEMKDAASSDFFPKVIFRKSNGLSVRTITLSDEASKWLDDRVSAGELVDASAYVEEFVLREWERVESGR